MERLAQFLDMHEDVMTRDLALGAAICEGEWFDGKNVLLLVLLVSSFDLELLAAAAACRQVRPRKRSTRCARRLPVSPWSSTPWRDALTPWSRC